MKWVLFTLLILLTSCVPTPEDPLDFGTICSPARADCPSSVLLQRDVTGRDQVDYIVRNVGSVVAIVEVVALVPSAVIDDVGLTTIAPEDLVARREHDPIPAGEVAENRFTAQDLGVREAFQLGIRCTGCDVELEWVFSTVPRECAQTDDCPAGWQCDDNLGRCAECLVNSDCNSDQRCNLETGRCDPPDTTAGCSTTGAPGMSGVLIALLFLLGLRRRKEVAAIALLVCLSFTPSVARASPPRASISVGAGARFVSGALAPVTKRGVGLNVGQELRWRYVGAAISLGTSYFLTTQQPPPFSRSFQTYGVTIGPRLYIPIHLFEFVAGPDYRRVGTANNSLVRLTGVRTSFDAVGGLVGARIRWSGLEVRLEGGGHYIVQLDSAMISTDLAVGFTNTQ